MIRGFVIDRSRTRVVWKEPERNTDSDVAVAGKRKLGEEKKDDLSTLDKLAELDLDSDEDVKDPAAVSPDEEDEFLSEDTIGSSIGRGRGRGQVYFESYNWKRSPAKFRQYRDAPGSMDDVTSSDVNSKEMYSKMFDEDDEAVKVVSKDADDDVDVTGEESDQLTELQPFEKGAMCQMKLIRTVAFDPTGKLKCSLSNAGSDTGKTESLMADTIRNLTSIYMKKRAEIVDSNGVVPTPVHAVKKLALAHNETLHCEITRFTDGTHRVEMFSGSLRGLGEGATKKIAAQMACIDLLERIQLSGGSVKAPTVAFLPGWLTSNNIFRDLINLCKSKDLPPIRFVSKVNVDDEGFVDPKRPPYHAECWLGEDVVTSGESEAEVFAKREAAKQMYYLVSNVEYRDTRYAIGQACRSVAELESSGHQPIMSDYKKMWLLQHRVENRRLMVPEEELGFDNQIDVNKLEKDIKNMPDAERVSYKLMRKKTIKVTVKNKKKRMDVDGDGDDESSMSTGSNMIVRRAVSVEREEDQDDGSSSDGQGHDDW